MKAKENMDEFYYLGADTEISDYAMFTSKKRIYIGKAVEIRGEASLVVNERKFNENLEYNIKIGDYSYINKGVSLEAFNYIEIGKYVTFGSYIYITDINHKYTDIHTPIMFQGFAEKGGQVIISDGCWIGSGVRIVGNITIGHGTVIGANAVVTRDIPSHAVAAGIPARVIKIYDYMNNAWVNVAGNTKLLHKILNKRGLFAGYNHEAIEYEIRKAGNIYNDIGGNLTIYDEVLVLLYKIITAIETEQFGDAIILYQKVLELIAIQYDVDPIFVIELNSMLNQIARAFEIKDYSFVKKILDSTAIPYFMQKKSEV